MNPKDKFLFIRNVISNSAKYKFFQKSGLDVRALLRYYGGVKEVKFDEQVVNSDFQVVSLYNQRYNISLITELNKSK